MSTSIGRIIKDASAKIQPILPFLVMAGAFANSSLIFVTLINVIVELAEWVYDRFFKPAVKKQTTYTLTIVDNSYESYFYRNVSIMLEEFGLTKNAKDVVINRTVKMKSSMRDDHFTPAFPVVEPGSGLIINFKHENFEVQITKNTPEKSGEKGGDEDAFRKKYTIEATSKKDIDNFIKFLTDYQYVIAKMQNAKTPEATHYGGMDDYDREFKQLTLNVKKTFNNIFLDNDIKEKLIEEISFFLNNKARYEKLGIAYRTGYILHGSPGNGKSSIILAISAHFNLNVYRFSLNTEKRKFLISIERIQPGSIVVFEDVDTCEVAQKREDEKKNSNKIQLGDVLAVLDGYYNLNGCIVIMTTNHIEKLDPALIRPGRIDHKIELHNVSKSQICEIVAHFFTLGLEQTCLTPAGIRDDIDISVAEFINSIVMPNLENYEFVRSFICAPVVAL